LYEANSDHLATKSQLEVTPRDQMEEIQRVMIPYPIEEVEYIREYDFYILYVEMAHESFVPGD